MRIPHSAWWRRLFTTDVPCLSAAKARLVSVNLLAGLITSDEYRERTRTDIDARRGLPGPYRVAEDNLVAGRRKVDDIDRNAGVVRERDLTFSVAPEGPDAAPAYR